MISSGAFVEIAMTVVVAAALYVAGSAMTGRVSAMPDYRVDLWKVALRLSDNSDALRYPWIRRSIMRDLKSLARTRRTGSLFDPQTCQAVAERLAHNPWVLEIREVAPAFPDKIRWKITYRLPAAIVETGPRYSLVDYAAKRLPVEFVSRPSGLEDLFVLSGLPEGVALPPVGEKYNHHGVETAVGMIENARALRSLLRSRGDDVRSVDIRHAGAIDRSGINFLTESGALIEWGRTVRGDLVPLVPLSHKFENMEIILDRDGTLKKGWIYRLWTPVPAAQPPEETNDRE